jgi:hypothetical protein
MMRNTAHHALQHVRLAPPLALSQTEVSAALRSRAPCTICLSHVPAAASMRVNTAVKQEAVRRAGKRTMPSTLCALHRRRRSPGKPNEGCFAQPSASHLGLARFS